MRRLASSIVALLLCVSSSHATQESSVPKRPPRPFSVFVYTSARGDPDVVRRIEKATDELRERLRAKEDWFRLAEGAGTAEIVVEVEALWENKGSWLQARSSFLGRVETLLGFGRVSRDRRSQERRAVSALARHVENNCRENYWELEERRSGGQSTTVSSTAEVGREWITNEVARRLERRGEKLSSIQWSNSVLELSTTTDTYYLTFDSGLSDCLLDIECQHAVAERILVALTPSNSTQSQSRSRHESVAPRKVSGIPEAREMVSHQGMTEGLSDEHRRWLNEEVHYIITDQERALFLSLETNAERARAIEAFWDRRDPDRVTVRNEFREEHYRRLKHVNQEFGRPDSANGWKTDRGRYYIILGKPRRIDRFVGSNEVVDCEVWLYEGDRGRDLPSRISLVFFKRDNAGDFELYNPRRDQPAALLHGGYLYSLNTAAAVAALRRHSIDLARASLTVDVSESVGAMTGRPTISPNSDLTLAAIEDAATRAVDTDYIEGYRRYGDRVAADFSFRYVSNRSHLVVFYDDEGTPFLHYSIELDPQDVTFRRSEDGSTYDTTLDVSLEIHDRAGVVVTTQRNQAEIELNAAEFQGARTLPIAYRDNLPLVPGVYTVVLLLKNLATQHYTVVEKDLVVNEVSTSAPTLGGVALTYATDVVEAASRATHLTYQLSKIVMQPAADGLFPRRGPINAVAQALNARRDQRLRITIMAQDRVLEENVISMEEASSGVLVQRLSTEELDAGFYTVVFDLLDEKRTIVTSRSAVLEVAAQELLARPGVVYRHSFASDTRGLVALTLANQYLAQGRIEEAESSLRRAVAANNPALPAARWKLAERLLVRQQPDEALELLLPQRDDYRDQVEVVEGLGLAFYLKGDCSQALEYLEDVVRLRQPDTSLMNIIGECYSKLNFPERASEAFKYSLSLDSDQEDVLRRLRLISPASASGGVAPFSIYVFANPRGEESAVERVNKAVDDATVELRKREEWFELVDTPEAANIVLEIKAYELRPKVVEHRQGTSMGPLSHVSHYSDISEDHYIYAEMNVFGKVLGLVGKDESKTAKRQRAVDDLVKGVEEYCVKNYAGMQAMREAK